MYKLIGAGFFQSYYPDSFGVALFSRPLHNYTFIAETDNFYNAIAFHPFSELNYLEIVSFLQADIYNIGDQIPISSRTNKFGVICEMPEFYHRNLKVADFPDSPIFQLQLSRVLGLLREDHIEIAERSTRLFSRERTREVWFDIEENSGNKDADFWLSFSRHTRKRNVILHELNLRSLADILDWLRDNTYDDSWAAVWYSARKLSPFSEDLAIISRRWIMSAFYNYDDVDVSKKSDILIVMRHVLHSTLADDEIYSANEAYEYVILKNIDSLHYFLDSAVSYRRLNQIFKHSNPKISSKIDELYELRR